MTMGPIVGDEFRPDLVDPLRVEILAREAVTRSAPTLNRGGWRSGEIFGLADRAMRELAESLRAVTEIDEAMRSLGGSRRLVGWAMVNRRGNHHPRHIHQGAILTGVYYVDPGDAKAPTIFETPTGEISIAPAPARIVLFSGDLWHRVEPYAGSAPRITIAFDVRR